MNKVYIVVDACSGEDYSVDDPTVLLVTTDYNKAKDFFYNEIENWRPESGVGYDDDIIEHTDGELIYECTDYDGDSHRIMRLVIKEVE